ncbi:hypothetical protein K491DRAFT_711528 [Lophiostoma macrostomum CBS 122681]|uniref:Uncharacterized protein n=1 Tax=Lophiostoma macrostomum CBS 122681 TaxID=1314788 RepID=A0A6A6TLK5_9PLEO|nr:hypothetical protein K491DRAFT_711528 [Lophiostoma macrostomum CBS 122681]
MATSSIAKRYTRLLSLWPKDLLRPTQPFTKAIEYRAVPYGVEPLPAPKDAPAKDAKPAVPRTPNADSKAELANINALYSLLENRYSKRYVMSPDVLKPKSRPEHYERLMEEIKNAPNKTWWQAKLDEWKHKIRWK